MRTLTLDANDIANGCDLAEKISNDICGQKINLGDLDALFDRIFDLSGGLRIIVKNAGKLSKDARNVFDDALARSTGLEVVMDYGDGRIERHASAPASNVNINITANNAGRPGKGGWWDVFYSRLVKLFLWIMALGFIGSILLLLFWKSA